MNKTSTISPALLIAAIVFAPISSSNAGDDQTLAIPGISVADPSAAWIELPAEATLSPIMDQDKVADNDEKQSE